ncbi:alpha-glucosidase [Fomitopsis serialis]|uniref:alpha-glucosidase n=1 Tax=Fomitopsis serialis TaxID=139415 RepID=UPI002007F43D|nr:alpha-glucosidase [Neoantrodia serialis]KAH9934909.1 alpha-glucosidase [Neoantrodia serialis]
MRFNDGFWLLKNGVRGHYGLQVVQALPEGDGYNLQVATKPIRHRGDTLAGPLLSVRVHSPSEGVIGVKIDHFRHVDPKPNFQLFPDDPPIPAATLADGVGSWTVTSGGLTAEVTENPYTITFRSPQRTLTTSGVKYQAIYDVPYKWTLRSAANGSCLATDFSSNPHPEQPPDSVRYTSSELNLSPGELIYGLGEQFGAFIKNGQSVSIWNQDGGTSSEQAYKCVPFYITNRNYGVFINHPGEVEVEVGSEKVSRVGVSVAGESLEYFIIYGATPLEVSLPPRLLPAWTFGLWLSTSFLTSYDEKTVSGFLQGMQDRNCPVRVFHLDCFWMKQYEWCSFTFDPDNFPNPKAYLAEIKQKYGVKICVWSINPYISQLSPIFQEALREGYLIKRTDGTPWQWDLWQPGLGVVDVTNPAARQWYQNKLDALIDLGVDTLKTDFGERIPHAQVVFHDGSDPMRMHNAFSVIYNEMVFGVLERRFGKGEAVVFARAASAGGQRYHWGGDCESTFEAMAESLRGALSLTASGFAFASHDIGGFEGHPPPEIYQRWVAYGLFSSHSRLHGSMSYRVPWHYGEETAAYMARFLDAKHRLMPYLYNLALTALLADRTTHHLDRQYMLGPSLLVAPVFVPEGENTEYYIPAGRWTSFFHPTRTIDGPQWVQEVVPLNEIPVYVRPGTLLCLGPKGIGRPDYEYSKDVEVQVYELADGQIVQADVPVGNGAAVAGTVRAEKRGGEVTVNVVAGSVELTSAKLFVGGHEVAASVSKGQTEVSLKF